MKDKTKGGILITDDVVERAQVASTCGLVLKVGPDAYRDERKISRRTYGVKKEVGLFLHVMQDLELK